VELDVAGLLGGNCVAVFDALHPVAAKRVSTATAASRLSLPWLPIVPPHEADVLEIIVVCQRGIWMERR
jgi:hypothetical protein